MFITDQFLTIIEYDYDRHGFNIYDTNTKGKKCGPIRQSLREVSILFNICSIDLDSQSDSFSRSFKALRINKIVYNTFPTLGGLTAGYPRSRITVKVIKLDSKRQYRNKKGEIVSRELEPIRYSSQLLSEAARFLYRKVRDYSILFDDILAITTKASMLINSRTAFL